MKRLWHSWLMVVASAMTVATAGAQEIGSYQSILARAGYGGGDPVAIQHAVSQMGQHQVAVQSGARCGSGDCGGTVQGYGGAYGNGGAMGYGGSMNHGGAMGYGGSMNHGGAMGYGGGAMNQAGSMGYGGNAMGYGGSMNHGGAMGYGGTANMNGGAAAGTYTPAYGAHSGQAMAGSGAVNGQHQVQGAINQGAVNGAVGNLGATEAVANGGATATRSVGQGMVSGGMQNGPAVTYGAPMYSAPSYGAANYGSVMGPSFGSNYIAPTYAAPMMAQPVYTPGQAFSGVARGLKNSSRNMVIGLFGLNLRRDYEDARNLAYNGAGGLVTSRDVENGNMEGLGVSLTSRKCDGSGFEAIYWGIDGDDVYDIAGPTTTALGGLTQVTHVASGANFWDIYNSGDSARLRRTTDIDNFEMNLLRNGGRYTTRSGKSATYELLGGFRLFQFDENLSYISNSTAAGYPLRSDYSLDAENTLAGIQLGGRSEICLSQRVRLAYGGKAGLFNNHAETNQRIFDETGAYARDINGNDVNYFDEKNDAAFLGELNLGLIFQMTRSARARLGYRAIGVSGVALSGNQIGYDFTDIDSLSNARTNGSLLLHGLVGGLEFCF